MLTNKQNIEIIAGKLGHDENLAVYNLFENTMNSIDNIIHKDMSMQIRIVLIGNLYKRFGDRLDNLITEYEKDA